MLNTTIKPIRIFLLLKLSLALVFVFSAGIVQGQPVVVDCGTMKVFTVSATNVAWRLDGAAADGGGNAFTYAPQACDVGTHYLLADQTLPGGAHSNTCWEVRARIVLPASGANYYVATTGADTNDGSMGQPFRTLERARNAVRTNGVPSGGVTVWIHGGSYRRTNTFSLTAADSGSDGSPVVYAAYPGETPIFTTGTPINSNSFTFLNSNLWARVMPGVAASNILELDLKALGVTNKGPFPTEFVRCPIVNPYSPGSDGGLCELFYQGQRQLLSRYPNNNPTNRWLAPFMKMNGVIYKTATNFMGTNIGGMFHFNPADAAHIGRWQTAAAETNLWIQGFWRIPWECEAERVLLIDTVSNTLATASGATPGVTGFGNKYTGPAGSTNEPFWALNLLEEIDQPGEWSIDFARGKLYFLPPGPVTNGAVMLSDFAAPVFQLNGCTNVVLSGLAFDLSLAQGIVITNGVNNLVQDCAFSNLGSFAVDLANGQSNGVVSCDLNRLAAGGILVRGGSEGTPRTSCNHYVVNNDITDFAQVVPVYAGGIDVGFAGMGGGGGGGGHQVCVGARVAHNHLADTPHGALIRGSFDKVIEYNWIENYCTISGDFGGIYSYVGTNLGGFDTLRYNYFSCPTNYVYPTYLNPGPPGGIGLQVDGFWVGDQIYGNIADSCRRGGFGAGGLGGSNAAFYNNFAVNISTGKSTVDAIYWSGAPSVYATNFAALGQTLIAGDQTGTNFAYSSDPGFLNWAKHDLRLKPDSRVYADQPGFQQIPFEMIGLYNDETRTNATGYGPYLVTGGATEITATNAVVAGTLYFPQFASNTTLRVFCGTNDGGNNAGAWQFSTNVGVYAAGPVSALIGGLAPSAINYYRYYASNAFGSAWSPASSSLVTRALPVPPVFTNLASVAVLPGTALVLTGRITGAGPVYPQAGEVVSVTINGTTQSGVIGGTNGDFSVAFDTTGMPVSVVPYEILYSYGGNIDLTAGTNAQTTLSICPPTMTWSGTAGTSFENGGIGGNWGDYAAPINDLTSSTAIFGPTPTANQPSLTANRSVYGLSFGAAAGRWALGNSGAYWLGVGSGGITSAGQSSGTNLIGANLTISANQTWRAGTGGTLLFTGSITNTSAATTNYSLTFNDSANKGNLILSPAAGQQIYLTGTNNTASIFQAKSGGWLQLGGDGVSSPVTFSTNVIINSGTNAYGALAINSPGKVRVNSGRWIFSDLGRNGSDRLTGTLEIDGGTISFGGARYLGEGNIQVNGGTLKVGSDATTHFVNGGRFSLGLTFTSPTGVAALNIAGGLVDLAQAGTSFGFANSAGAQISTLVNVSGGTLQIGVTPGTGGFWTGFSLGGTGTGTTNNRSAITLSDGALLCAGTVRAGTNAGPGSINNFNFMGGVLSVSNLDATYFGSCPSATATANQTNISAAIGTLANYGGALAPGNLGIPGQTIIAGNYAVSNPAAALAIDLGGPNAASGFQSASTNYDTVAVTGNATLGGSLKVKLLNSFVPAVTNRFVILTAASVSGAFANVAGSRVYLDGSLDSFAVNYTATNVTLTSYQPAPPVPNTPTNLSWTVSNDFLALSWPSNYQGWLLQVQTNSMRSNWFVVPGSQALFATNLPIVSSNRAVFFRLKHP